MKRYIGKGAYLGGVPMRDLSEDEWDALTPEQQAAAQPLYQDDRKPAKGEVK